MKRETGDVKRRVRLAERVAESEMYMEWETGGVQEAEMGVKGGRHVEREVGDVQKGVMDAERVQEVEGKRRGVQEVVWGSGGA